MKKAEAILRDETYLSLMEKISEREKDREFCRHGISHSLDVARIAYILNLEREYGFDRELIYGMALLHDIGRACCGEESVSHRISGLSEAESILQRAGYPEKEREAVLHAIQNHGDFEEKDRSLDSLLFEADKLSRNCFICPVREDCYWEEARKNKTVYR